MGQLVRFEGQNGAVMLVEVTAAGDSSRLDLVGGSDGEPARAAVKLEESLTSVQGAAAALQATVEELQRREQPLALDEVSMDFSVSVGVEGGVIVAKGSATAEMSVTLTWRKPSG